MNSEHFATKLKTVIWKSLSVTNLLKDSPAENLFEDMSSCHRNYLAEQLTQQKLPGTLISRTLAWSLSSSDNLLDDCYHVISNKLEINDTTGAARSASCLDLHLEIDNDDRSRIKLSDNRDDFNFLIENFQFICSNIPAARAYGLCIYQLMRYSRVCGSYHDSIYSGLLLTRKLQNQGFSG